MCPFIYQAFMQILDGILTYVGVLVLSTGTASEGNPLLRHCMETYGVVDSLIIFKAFGILVALGFMRPHRKQGIVRVGVFMVNLFYTVSSLYWIWILVPVLKGLYE